jgi:hypothetical protein
VTASRLPPHCASHGTGWSDTTCYRNR